MPLDRHYVNPSDGPAPAGYTHAVRMGSLLFVSGQLALDARRQLVGPGDVGAQTRQALENVGRVLGASGAAWTDVAKLTIFLVDMRGIGRVREARQAFYAEQGIEPPAATTVGVTGLSVEGALIEIEAYAVVGR
ncbi:MAG: RidA family protein [Chloroflexi bacterium]|nr:RidA family protein [Chloroflexota bacterium]